MSDRCSGFVARCCIRRVRGFAVAACAAPTGRARRHETSCSRMVAIVSPAIRL
ncbi:hypothetical protein LC55x_5634 [Lysobacter capsici]|nr:hypothetical protein LC55x_5634 [Lysobacter capsici]